MLTPLANIYPGGRSHPARGVVTPSLSWVKMFASVKRSSLFRDDGKKGFQFRVSINEAREAKNWQDG
jgi:hypothetical protein